MPNPYESPNASSRETNASPRWYVLFYKAYWPAWWIETILIAMSWFGVLFGLCPNNEIACGMVADTIDLGDTAASELAGHAHNVFDKLLAESNEFKASVVCRTVRVSIMSDVDQSARELCRVVDGKLN